MGKIKNPLKIHWNGGVDGLIGYYRKGAACFRSYAQSVFNPNTPRQLEVRAKFTAVSRLVSLLKPAYNLGFAAFEGDGRTARDVASAANQDAVSITDGLATTDYSRVVVSAGPVPNPYSIVLTANAATHTIAATWSDNTGIPDTNSNDDINLQIVNVTRGQAIFGALGVRSSEGGSLVYPTEWAGDTIYCYVFSKSAVSGLTSPSVAKGPLSA